MAMHIEKLFDFDFIIIGREHRTYVLLRATNFAIFALKLNWAARIHTQPIPFEIDKNFAI